MKERAELITGGPVALRTARVRVIPTGYICLFAGNALYAFLCAKAACAADPRARRRQETGVSALSCKKKEYSAVSSINLMQIACRDHAGVYAAPVRQRATRNEGRGKNS